MTSMDFPDLNLVPEMDEESSEEVNFDEMVAAAQRIRFYAEEMVKHSPANMSELNQLGAKLSSEYDSLSLASVKAVQSNIENDASRVLRISVLQLGQRCLQLITELCDDQRMNIVNGETSNNLENEVSKEIDVVLNVLQLLQDTSHFHNVYWKFIEALENIFNIIKQPSDESGSTIKNIDFIPEETVDAIIKESRNLYNLIKMIIVNLVSPNDEKVATLQHFLRSVGTLQKLITSFVANTNTSLIKKTLSISAESLISLLIDLLITCNEAEDSITSQHTKAILKVAVKDVLQNLRGIVELFTAEKLNIKITESDGKNSDQNGN